LLNNFRIGLNILLDALNGDFTLKINHNSSDVQKNEELTKEKSDIDSLSLIKKQKCLDMKNSNFIFY